MDKFTKLKTNLKLTIQRLKLLQKKKSKPPIRRKMANRVYLCFAFSAELSLKSRKEIADYLAINKVDRAKIRVIGAFSTNTLDGLEKQYFLLQVEHIIREDNYVEAIDLLESYCDLLLARFGLIEKMKQVRLSG
jgi:vacuolar protein sorting-associated protein IST1